VVNKYDFVYFIFNSVLEYVQNNRNCKVIYIRVSIGV